MLVAPPVIPPRMAVLARLAAALGREPVPGVRHRRIAGDTATLTLDDGRTLTVTPAGGPLTAPPPPARVTLDGRRYADPAHLLTELGRPGLAAELADSGRNLALARRAAEALPAQHRHTLAALAGGADPDPTAYLEQSVVDGHPLHPGCRTRSGLSAADQRAYAPEHRPVVALPLYAVPPAGWLSTGDGLPPVLPVHPWQERYLREHPDTPAGRAFARLRPTGQTLTGRPLLSLRTLALADRHLKTAVDAQLTSAVRIVSGAAVRNGPPLSALVAGLAGPGLEVLVEFAAGAVLADGEPCPSLAVVHRRAPATGPGELAAPLAALAAPSPATGRAYAVEVVRDGYAGDPRGYLAALAAVLLPPLLELLAAGVALEAHGQNTMVVLRDGRVRRAAYRDFGGVRVDPARLRRHGAPAPPAHGALGTDDPVVLRTTLVAGLVVALAEQVTVLAREHGEPPEGLWASVAGAVRAALPGLSPGAAAEGRSLLAAGTVPVKATTAMRLADAPLEPLWCEVPNPLAGDR